MNLSECGICTERYFEKEFVELPCNHKFCKTCIGKYWNAKISEGHTKLQCANGCELVLDPFLQTEVITLENLELLKYNIKKVKAVGNAIVVCEACSSETKITPEMDSIECSQCKAEICTKCGYTSHEYQECDQYILSKAGVNKELSSNMSKCCPKCHFIITKHKGCDHMTCSRCKHEFKWSEIKNTNDATKNQLKIATKILQLTKAGTFTGMARTTCYQLIDKPTEVHKNIIDMFRTYAKQTCPIQFYPSYLMLEDTLENQKKMVRRIVNVVESIVLSHPEKFSVYINYNYVIPSY